MNLIVDIGNTQVKLALFDNNDIVKVHSCNLSDSVKELEFFTLDQKINGCIISSVITNHQAVEQKCKELANTLLLDDQTPIPIKNKYLTPQSLGKDRLSCAVALNSLFPEQPALSIDFGTCIKYDLVTERGEYLGGAISPGMQMRFKALNTFTSQLPLLEPKLDTPLIGKTTEESILSGVINGISAEVNHIIDQYRSNFDQLMVVITGGDYKYFEKALKNITFADPYLVLKGLNEILIFNTKN